MPDLPPLTVIVGPTASGKTELAVRLAETLGGEVISADSVQIYRGFDLGSGKPSAAERSRAPHHLIDCCDPFDPMDASRWAELAEAALTDIRARGREPILCGGTFLWVRALIFGLAEAPPADPVIRARHQAWAAQEGRNALHVELTRVDPTIAQRLSPNDLLRVSRALEVFELTGKPLSEWQAQHGFREPRYEVRLLGVERAREELDVRIEQRVRSMFASGWVEEVRSLIQNGLGEARAMKSVGYRQLFEALSSPNPAAEEQLIESVVRATRIFVRRQRTWLREEAVTWLPPNGLPNSGP